MAKNQDNAAKAAKGKEVKRNTKTILQECEYVTLLPKGQLPATEVNGLRTV
jgi:hypothetical protein